jgi:type I restriction enzyme, R subunit
MSTVSLESEYQTRRRRIDPLLTSQGWKIIRSDLTNVIAQYPHHAVTEYPTADGPADYALFVDNQLSCLAPPKLVWHHPRPDKSVWPTLSWKLNDVFP